MARCPNAEFVEKARKVHGNLYDYSSVNYVNNHTKIKVVCDVHGPWYVIPNNHLSGAICKSCAIEKRAKATIDLHASKFVERAKSVPAHQGRGYTYHKVVYKNTRTKVVVTCPKHEDFLVSPNSHLYGAGCPRCTICGYNSSKEGWLYILTCSDGITKIGITNKHPDTRAKSVSRSYGGGFTCTHSYLFKDGAIPQRIEKELLAEMKKLYKQPEINFDGFKECFYNVDLAILLVRVQQMIQEHSDAPQQ